MPRKIGFSPVEGERLLVDDIKTENYVGEIVDIDDPDKRFRARVKVYGKFDKLETEQIPWAEPIFPMVGGKDGHSMFSSPRIGQKVYVNFLSGNLYTPVYYGGVEIDPDMQGELGGKEHMTCLMYDSEEDVKVYYSQDKGMYILTKGSEINISKDSVITINHKDSTSTIELNGSKITLVANSTIDVTANNDVNITGNQKVNVQTNEFQVNASSKVNMTSPKIENSGAKVDIGASPVFSSVNGEPLMQLLTQLAINLDLKIDPTPGVNLALVTSLRELILSKTVKTTP